VGAGYLDRLVLARQSTRVLLACTTIASGASCSLVTSLDGLSGGPAADASAPDTSDVRGEDGAAPDAAADGSPFLDSPVVPDVSSPDGSAGDSGWDAATDSATDGATDSAVALTYRDTILTDTPLAYWRFGEATGTIAGDENGNGNAATLGTGVTWGAMGALLNDPNTAIHLGGTQGLIAGNTFDFPGNAPYSLEAWVNPDMALDGKYRHLFVKDDTTQPTGREEYGVYLQVNDGLAFERYVTGTARKAFAPAPPINQWSYVVATYDGTQLSLYVNGAVVQRTPDTRPQASKNASEYLGCKSFNYVSVLGSLDEFAIYDHALTDAQVAAHWKASGR
jgi:hypothetical protein